MPNVTRSRPRRGFGQAGALSFHSFQYIEQMMEPLRPALTLAEIRALNLITSRHIAAAREHVGAAGLEQATALERMINISREQTLMTQTLERLSRTLQNDPPEETQAQHLAAAELRLASVGQLTAAHQLEHVIALALQNVTQTPLAQISASVLTQIGDQVKAQIQDLEALVKEAQISPSPAREAALDQIEVQAEAARKRSAQHEISRQLHFLGGVSEDAVAQIVQVAGASSAQQIKALERVAEKAQQQLELIRQPS